MKTSGPILKSLVSDFFAANPDEYLLIDDVVTKWGRSKSKVVATMNELVEAGQLGRYEEKTGPQGRRWVYTANIKQGMRHYAK